LKMDGCYRWGKNTPPEQTLIEITIPKKKKNIGKHGSLDQKDKLTPLGYFRREE